MPLPDGYKMRILPEYWLETPTICVLLTRTRGAILALLMASYGRHVSLGEIVKSLYGHMEEGGPLAAHEAIRCQLSRIRSQLSQYGVRISIKSTNTTRRVNACMSERCDTSIYRLESIEPCEPSPGMFREKSAPVPQRNSGHCSMPRDRASPVKRRLCARKPPTAPAKPRPHTNLWREFSDPRALPLDSGPPPYARHARHEKAEAVGYYERPLTNEELALIRTE